MSNLGKIVIKNKKFRAFVLFLWAAVCAAGGVIVLTMDMSAIQNVKKIDYPILFYGIGTIFVLFFCVVGWFYLKRVSSRSPGLILDDKGLTDRSSGASVGFVPWSEIVGLSTHKVRGQRWIIVQVSNPEKYAKMGNFLQRIMKKENYMLTGSPVYIVVNMLKIEPQELHDLIERHFDRCRAVN